MLLSFINNQVFMGGVGVFKSVPETFSCHLSWTASNSNFLGSDPSSFHTVWLIYKFRTELLDSLGGCWNRVVKFIVSLLQIQPCPNMDIIYFPLSLIIAVNKLHSISIQTTALCTSPRAVSWTVSEHILAHTWRNPKWLDDCLEDHCKRHKQGAKQLNYKLVIMTGLPCKYLLIVQPADLASAVSLLTFESWLSS